MKRIINIPTFLNYENKAEMPNYILVNKFNEEGYKKFLEDFDKAAATNPEVIPILVDSYGGACYSLLSMIDIINSSRIPVATIVTSKAMSCGSVLLSAGTKGLRFASPNSTVMVHAVSSYGEGKINDLEQSLNNTKEVERKLFRILDKNCGQKPGFFIKELDKIKNSEWYLTAAQAKKIGMVDHIGLPQLRVTVSQTVDLVL